MIADPLGTASWRWSAGVCRDSEKHEPADHQEAQEDNGCQLPWLRADWLLALLPSYLFDHGNPHEHEDDGLQDLHAQGIGSSSGPVQPLLSHRRRVERGIGESRPLFPRRCSRVPVSRGREKNPPEKSLCGRLIGTLGTCSGKTRPEGAK